MHWFAAETVIKLTPSRNSDGYLDRTDPFKRLNRFKRSGQFWQKVDGTL